MPTKPPRKAPGKSSGNKSKKSKFKMVSLFSGIGGFDLGFEKVGFEVALQCEIDKFCSRVLRAQWPNVPIHENIKELQANQIPEAEVWAGGFPCQDVSLARMGAREGLRGSRSGLFHEFARLVGEARPRVVLFENVAGLLNSHGGRDFGLILKTLADIGYSVGWRVLNSKNFGVPQSRQRVYIVGCYRDRLGPSKILFEQECGGGDATTGKQNGKTTLSPFKTIIGENDGDGPVYQAIAYCLYACSARHTGTDWSRTYVQYPKKAQVRRLTPKECEGIMGFPENWTLLKDSKPNEDVDSLRYHALGNAVTPPVAEWLATRINNYLL